MNAPDPDVRALIAAMEAKQERLEREVQWLHQQQNALDSRLERVENSIIFRTLRAIGTFYFTRVARKKAGSLPGYLEWRKGAVANLPPLPVSSGSPFITLFIPLQEPNPEGLRRALNSVRAQTYSHWELIVISQAPLASWLQEYLRQEQIPCLSTFAGARKQAKGEWIGMVGESDFLAATALQHCVASLPADLLYTDEEIIDRLGNPLRPLLKPDWSPVLLQSTAYLGGLLLVSRDCLQKAGETVDSVEEAVQHLANTPLQVVHVPRVLYHSLDQPRLTRKAAPKPVLARTPLVSIVICTRTSRLLAQCLEGLRNKTDYANKEVIVVQHLGTTSGAEEESIRVMAQQYAARIVPYSEPFNFSDMNNLGVRSATGEILLFLNDDVYPLSADWLTRLVARLEDPAVGAVGAKLLYPSGAIQHAGIATWLIDGAGHPGRNLFVSDHWPWLDYPREVTAVTGACMAVRRADFERLGRFDPIFPVNYNDVDLCLRLRREGFSILLEADALLRHDESQTRKAGTQYQERRLFFQRWASEVEKVDPYYSPFLAQNNENLSLR
jgi:O-antigen biosynthesis protein